MKKLTLKLVVPLTIISFATFTKWWYALPVDTPDTMFKGFPLIFSCPGWHTSMSTQFFVIELLVDILIYFSFWFFVVYLIDKYLKALMINKVLTICLWIISGLFIAFGTFLITNKDNLFYAKRPFQIKVLETGYEFIWQTKDHPDYYKSLQKNKQ